MAFETAVFNFAHILVLVYWLGGDLGAFYASRFLTRPGISADRRLLAAKIVGDVDMAPRSALILAFPTGLLLASLGNWITLDLIWGYLVMLAALAWLALAWHLHLAHGKPFAGVRIIDLTIRWALAAALIVAGITALTTGLYMASFLALKCLLLAGAILCGLYIRRVLRPLGPALAGLADPDPRAAEASLADTLRRAKPLVIIIWVLISSAAFVGVWKPNFF